MKRMITALAALALVTAAPAPAQRGNTTLFTPSAAARHAAALAAPPRAQHHRAGAIAIYDRVAAGGGDRQLRDVAALLASIQVLNGGGADLDARLAPLAEGAGYWRHLARELQAIAALKKGGRAEAKDIFSVLAEDADAPAGVRRRAAEMIARIGGTNG